MSINEPTFQILDAASGLLAACRVIRVREGGRASVSRNAATKHRAHGRRHTSSIVPSTLTLCRASVPERELLLDLRPKCFCFASRMDVVLCCLHGLAVPFQFKS